jgi:hypothetical protein
MISHYAREGASRNETPVAIWVCLVALSFKPLPEYRDYLMAFDSPDVRWLPELKGRLIADYESTKRIILNPSPIVDSTPIAQTAGANQRAEVPVKPKLIISGERRT